MHQNRNEFLVGIDDAGRRIDRIVRIMLPGTSLSLIYKLLRTGQILLNDKKAKPECKVAVGDRLCIANLQIGSQLEKIAAPPTGNGNQSFADLILLETPDLVFINKPRGMLTHGQAGVDILSKLYFGNRAGTSLAFTPAPVHRLDRNTSGLLAVSASLRGAQVFSRALQSGQLKKHYLALVQGLVPTELRWEDWLVRDDDKKRSGLGESGSGQRAVSSITPIVTGAALSLVNISLETGRTHQIRAQCAAHGHSLLGDRKYGGGYSACGYFLHAWKLESPPDLLPGMPPRLVAPLPGAAMDLLRDCFPEKKLENLFLA